MKTTTEARAQAILLAARAKAKAQARIAAAPASTVIRELGEDVLKLADLVEILCGALGEAEFRR